MTTTARGRLGAILAEQARVLEPVADDAVDRLATAILAARRIALYGVGRNGLVLQALAMRLAHLGLDAAFVGQLAAPPIGGGDLFLAAMATGRLPTADALAATARAAGARIAVVTARPDAVLAADLVVPLPAQTMADPMASVLPLGSPFELALWLLAELTVAELMDRLGKDNAALARRHTNLL